MRTNNKASLAVEGRALSTAREDLRAARCTDRRAAVEERTGVCERLLRREPPFNLKCSKASGCLFVLSKGASPTTSAGEGRCRRQTSPERSSSRRAVECLDGSHFTSVGRRGRSFAAGAPLHIAFMCCGE